MTNLENLNFDLRTLDLDRLWDQMNSFISSSLPATVSNRPSLDQVFMAFMDAHKAKWFTTPASTRQSHHHAYRGGLFIHCCEVYNLMLALSRPFEPFVSDAVLLPPSYHAPAISPASALLVAFLHDVHKFGDAAGHAYYEDNVSIKTGKVSDKIPFRTVEDYLKVSVVYHDQGPPNLPAEQAQYLINQGILADAPGGLQSLAYIHATAPALGAQLTEDRQAHQAGGFQGGGIAQLQLVRQAAGGHFQLEQFDHPQPLARGQIELAQPARGKITKSVAAGGATVAARPQPVPPGARAARAPGGWPLPASFAQPQPRFAFRVDQGLKTADLHRASSLYLVPNLL